jgi:hypothetical protein
MYLHLGHFIFSSPRLSLVIVTQFQPVYAIVLIYHVFAYESLDFIRPLEKQQSSDIQDLCSHDSGCHQNMACLISAHRFRYLVQIVYPVISPDPRPLSIYGIGP